MRELQLERVDAAIEDAIDQAGRGEPSIIAIGTRPKAVIVSLADWEAIRDRSFGAFLLSAPFEEGDLPERDRQPMRLPDWAR